jgi:hypothetical protein
MKTKQLLIAIVALVFFQVNNLAAQTFKVKSFAMAVKGTSSIHDWESQVERLDCKTSYKVEENILIDIREAVVKIPVQSIKSPKGKLMDNRTYKAFNFEKYPFIVFTLSGKKIDASNLTADLKGSVSMAGATRPIDLAISYNVLANGDLRIVGSKEIKMTEFNMEPPTAMMGAIKVGDEVVISFDIVFSSTLTNL